MRVCRWPRRNISIKRCRRQIKPPSLYTYEGDDHNLAQSFGLAMQRTIEFFDKYVKGS